MEVKIKYDSVKAITGKFPNGIAAMMALLAVVTQAIEWVGYFVLTPDKQLVWEKSGEVIN